MRSILPETASLIMQIQRLAGSFRLEAARTRWYLFGSALSGVRGKSPVQDVDLAVIYEEEDIERVLALRKILRNSEFPSDLDITLLTKTEEQGVDFIASERAMLIWEG